MVLLPVFCPEVDSCSRDKGHSVPVLHFPSGLHKHNSWALSKTKCLCLDMGQQQQQKKKRCHRRSFSFLQGIWVYRVRLERERKGKGNITERKKGARGHGQQRLNHKQQEETQRKLFGQSSTTLSFVTLGQNL